MRTRMRILSVSLALCLAMVTCLCGCGGPTPTETADTFLTAVKAGDEETIKTVYAGGSFDVLKKIDDDESDSGDDLFDDDYFNKTLVPKILDFDYELSNEQIDGDKATVDVKITTYDLGGVFTAFMSEYFSQALVLAFSDASEEKIEELANTIFENKLSAATEKTYSETVPLELVKEDDVWKVAEIDGDSEFMNALCGNMIKTIDQLEEQYSFDEDEE